jgi:hypothetical protein
MSTIGAFRCPGALPWPFADPNATGAPGTSGNAVCGNSAVRGATLATADGVTVVKAISDIATGVTTSLIIRDEHMTVNLRGLLLRR